MSKDEKGRRVDGAGCLADACDSRANVYAILSRCYEREIDEETAAAIAGGKTVRFEDGSLADAWSGMVNAMEPREGVDLIENLAVDFDRVFFGMGPRSAKRAFPYESVYTSERGLMKQDAYAEVLHEFRSRGFAKAEGFHEPEDHLAVELAYMEKLSRHAAVSLRGGDEEAAEAALMAQGEFAAVHLANWIDRFSVEAEQAATEPFYRSLAVFTRLFIGADRAFLDEVLE